MHKRLLAFQVGWVADVLVKLVSTVEISDKQQQLNNLVDNRNGD